MPKKSSTIRLKIFITSAALAVTTAGCSNSGLHHSRDTRFLASDDSPTVQLTCQSKRKTGNEKSSRFAERIDCGIGDSGKTVHILRLKGSLEQISYDNGYLLAKESYDHLAGGQTGGTIGYIRKKLSDSSNPTLAKGLYDCVSDSMLFSSDPAFNRANEQFAAGMKAGMNDRRKFTLNKEDLKRATVASDTGIVLDGSINAMIHGSTEEKARAYAATAACAPYLIAAGTSSGPHDIMRAFGNGLRLSQDGCTGFIVPESETDAGTLLHARNLDSELTGAFAAEPTVFLIDEQGTILSGPNKGRAFFKYVAAASAGTVFPGGVTGFNDQGISVSLHEMQSRQVRATLPGSTAGTIGPFLQQRILREAQSIDEAFEIAKSTARYASWSILIADSKTGESATIELSAEKAALADRMRGEARAQTNHFLSPEMADQFYDYDFNKYLETRARYKILSETLSDTSAKNPMTVDQAIDLLSDHHDAEVPGEELRAFGRTVVKSDTALSTIALPKTKQLWMSSSDRYPVPHADFFGLRFDFDAMTAQPIVSTKHTRQFAAIPNWEQSLETFTRARLAAQAGRENQDSNDEKALKLVEQAITQAAQDGKTETSYEFMRARLLHKLGAKNSARYAQALEQWQQLLDQSSLMDHEGYLLAITQMYTILSSDAVARTRSGKPLTDEPRNLLIASAKSTLSELYLTYHHFDLEPKMDIMAKLKDGKSIDDAELPAIDWVTIEH